MSPPMPRLGAVPDILDDNALTVYVDGSMFRSPRRGGIGIHFVCLNEAGTEEEWDHSLPAVMGHSVGSAGPFCSKPPCDKWRQTYFAGATCDTSAQYPLYAKAPDPCQG